MSMADKCKRQQGEGCVVGCGEEDGDGEDVGVDAEEGEQGEDHADGMEGDEAHGKGLATPGLFNEQPAPVRDDKPAIEFI